MQNKTLRYDFVISSRTKIKRLGNTVSEGLGKQAFPYIADGKISLPIPYGRQFSSFYRNEKDTYTSTPTIPPLGNRPTDILTDTGIHRNACSRIFVIATDWKNIHQQGTGQIKYTLTVEYM